MLRLYIDKPDGIKVEDCERVSRSVGAILDVENVIDGRYNLEVSSPGIERPVRRIEDFKKFVGNILKIRTVRKIEEKKNFSGTLKDVTEETVKIEENGQIYSIPLSDVSKARLVIIDKSGGK